MTPIASWQCLSVGEFFKQANWDGASRHSPQTFNHSSSTSLLHRFNPALTAWGSWTVQDFFEAQNWMGQPLDSGLFIHEQNTFAPVLTASVQDFFQYLPWEGPPTIAHLPDMHLTKPLGLTWVEPDERLTLTDLSDLF